MSQPRGFSQNGKSYFTNVTTPQDINLQFTVTPTNGLGVTSVKSNGYVRNVFMHTSTTPTANDGYTNPNPATGYVAIQLNNNFNYYLSNLASYRAPNSGSDVSIDNSALTAGLLYTITTLGDASAAKWLSIGVPAGITPAVGVSFIATAVGSGSNVLTSKVQVPSTSGVFAMEQVGNPGVMLSSANISSNGGAWICAQFMAPIFTAGAYTPAGTISAPVFTGSALDTHTHSIPPGTDGGGGTSGATSGGTPAGTNSAPEFTGSAGSLTGSLALSKVAPGTGTVISLLLKYDGSSVTIDGI